MPPTITNMRYIHEYCPDQGMMLAPRWSDEESILMKSRSTVKIHGIPEFLEV